MEELPIETTVFSMSPAPPADVNRRADERHLTLFRVGAIRFDGRRELCLVKNISAGGVLVRAYCTLRSGQPVAVELKEGQPVSGTVSWVKNSDAGITFDQRVDVLDLLKSSGDGPRPRMPRVEVHCVAFVREGATVHRAAIHNVSQGGVSVETVNPLTVGSDVTVTLPGLPPQGAVVRWQDGARYGINFNALLPLAGLVEWLHARNGA
ncbi:PilZ domain-containing protein [Sphingomonas sabuli]|uniref:PilZ domain-containing protein n=1 Tax=Sphingomonas sabuli TaxID=2764186 RepID=A0A7G9L322_9SPHN|nr:PilZ domain-containing protein [Sphingomonas sabuli]QNM83021.1 PilZ domain-containing protein [Sphingomonas sabuli]